MAISYDEIYEDACRLVKTYNTRQARAVLEERGVVLIPFSKATKVLGMYKVIKRNHFVFYNPYVDERIQNMVLAHELGHHIYHREQAAKGQLMEYELFDICGEMELEANIFAAHFMIDDGELMEALREGYSYDQLAMKFNVNVNLIIFKLNELQRMGHPIQMGEVTDRSFFSKIDGRDDRYGQQ